MNDAGKRVPGSRAASTGKWYTARLVYTVMMIAGSVAMAYTVDPAFAAAIVGFFIIVLLVTTIRFRRQARLFAAANATGIAALARGDLKTARTIFWRWAEATKLPRASALARHNLAWTLARQGELQQAIEVLTDNRERNTRALKAIGIYPTTAVHLALYHALLGDLAAAEKWMSEAEKRENELSQAALPAVKALARAVLDCRTGRCSEAARMLEEQWAQLEAMLTGAMLRPLRIVRAFAIAAGDVRNAGLADNVLSAARPAYPGEYDFLGKAWPEMASFLAAHDL